MTIRILFVCLGNICRSPLAEAALRSEGERLGLDLEVDSAGTGDWHVGQPPDPRARAAARRHGANVDALRARQIQPGDFYRFDHVIALDPQNLRDLERIRPADAPARLTLFLDHLPGRAGEGVADPYHGEDRHFDATWRDVTKASRALAQKLAAEH